MNRQMKRMQEKAERQGRRAGLDRKASASATARRAQVQERRKRTPARQFLKEVRAELKKVDWPTRRELVSFSIVVLVTIVVLTAFVAGVDFLFSKAILTVLS